MVRSQLTRWQLISVAALLTLVICAANSFGAQPPVQTSEANQKETFWLIPHTHWEGAVFKTREEYLEMGLPNILKALYLLKKYPDYRFVLDQVAYVKPFLERYPEQEAAFRQFLSEGRLQLVGGMNIMPDVNLPSGESFIRQVLYGKNYYREKLGVDVSVGWLLDTFGHHAQMPQLLKKLGLNSFWFFRGVPNFEVPSEFLWQGLDGTQIPAFWLPYGYGILYGSPGNVPQFEAFMRGRFDSLDNFSRGPDRVGLAGADVSDPEEHVPVLVKAFNEKSDAPFTIRFAVPTEFEAAVAKRRNRQVIEGEFNPVFQGVYSSRIDVKQWIRSLERLLTSAEKFGVLANWLGVLTDQQTLWRAWEPMLFNQTHDLASGVMVDKVYQDSLRGYEFSKRLTDEVSDGWFAAITSRIDTRGEGIPVVVFNTLSWPRTDIATVEFGFSERDAYSISLVNPQGQTIPVQVLDAQHYGSGGFKRVTIAFVARGVPALGYSVYHVIPEPAANPADSTQARYRIGWSRSTAQKDIDFIENEFYRVSFDLWTGAMTSLLLKEGKWEALAGPGNVIAREHDGGDFWELYGTLNGARNIAMTRRHSVPERGKAQFSNEQVGGSGRIQTGPVISQYSVSHPFGSGNFATTVRVYPGIRRIDISTRILNNDKFVRYRALFPTSIQNGKNVHEIPFGAVERPPDVEMPAQNWIDYSSGEKGMALLNRGIPGNNIAHDTMMLSLLRSTRIEAYAFHGGYEPGISSESGLELGKEVTLNYALVPHSGDWRDAAVYRAGLEFNHPLISRKAASHPGVLPKRWGSLEVSHPNVVLSALKPGRRGATVLRVYEASGRPTPGVQIRLHVKVNSAHEANLMEDAGSRLEIQDDTLRFDLGAYEIKTFLLQLRR